jgi:hypothetical protein
MLAHFGAKELVSAFAAFLSWPRPNSVENSQVNVEPVLTTCLHGLATGSIVASMATAMEL